jgi:hypothetical protein
MAISEQDILKAERRMAALRESGFAVSARYDHELARVVVALSTGIEIAFPPRLAEGLADATQNDLVEIEISPAGLGLHWPKLDADVYLPGLLQGRLGSKRWLAAELGAAGGRARSPAKAEAARENGRKGGRPRKPGLDGRHRDKDGEIQRKLSKPIPQFSPDTTLGEMRKKTGKVSEAQKATAKEVALAKKRKALREDRKGPAKSAAKRRHA